jgi:acyl-CoA synthetase (AMP-forming)/AMP-acid ligase II
MPKREVEFRMGIMRKMVSIVAKKKTKEIEHILNNPIEVADDKLKSILSHNSSSIYGRRHKFDSVSTHDDYAENVPLVEPEDLTPWLEIVYENPTGGILTTEDVAWYLLSSGTTGKPKKIPVTERGVTDCKTGSMFGWMSYMLSKPGNDRIIDGTMVTFGAPAILDYVEGVPVGYASGFYMTRQNKMFQRLVEPGMDVFNMTDVQEKMWTYAKLIASSRTTVIQGIASLGLSMIRKLENEYGPRLLDEFRGTRHEKRIRNALQDDGTIDVGTLCPDLQMFGSSGIDISPYRSWLENQIPGIDIWDFYGMSEAGIIGTQTTLEPGIKLFPSLNYYEFIPKGEVESPNPIAIPLSDVVKGKSYEIVVTSSNGYYRYRPGDMVTFIDTDPYTVSGISRKGKTVNMAGEKLSEAHVMNAIEHASRTTGLKVMDYTMVGSIERGQPYYTLAVMFSGSSPNQIEFLEAFEESVKNSNFEFKDQIESGGLGRIRLAGMIESVAERVVVDRHVQAKPIPLSTDDSLLEMCAPRDSAVEAS